MIINTKLFTNRLRELVADNKLKEAVMYLCAYLESDENLSLDIALSLKGRLLELEKRELIGVVDYKNVTTEQNQIRNAILTLVRTVFETDKNQRNLYT